MMRVWNYVSFIAYLSCFMLYEKYCYLKFRAAEGVAICFDSNARI